MWFSQRQDASQEASPLRTSYFHVQDDTGRQLMESTLACIELSKFTAAMTEFPKITNVLNERTLELQQSVLQLLRGGITDEARSRDIQYYKSINSTPIVEARNSQLSFVNEQAATKDLHLCSTNLVEEPPTRYLSQFLLHQGTYQIHNHSRRLSSHLLPAYCSLPVHSSFGSRHCSNWLSFWQISLMPLR